MKTFVLDDNWEKVVSGDMTMEEWMELATPGPELDMTEDKLEEAIEKDLGN